ncbi:putative vacuolar protein sorting-associated protein [Dothidotthia symphoricarpi CBS 119687]|uniref:Putative vacuolar protein sorting-associated protein n=1 Tax=Dothidotthia symphoricarpi CBS 119687 TaxID=1392245 RepID=A0A6A6A1A3_9PLEO|nr:putative vacuolar protein sorting-associated protein [Dothidotthia symphoricarpi CBS 119687]KAF2125610.1 putative vacuolar protein sorting-associated protein [Dothidotthia symphoricarpi CBS 119687]
MANKTFDYGDLRISMTSSYTWNWDDTGSGASRDVGVWTPNSQGDLYPVGSHVEPHHNDINGKRGSLIVGQNPNTKPSKSAVARPVDYTEIWRDTKSGATKNGAFWRPVPPAGYVALGDVGSDHNKPNVNKIWCVREDLVGYGRFLATSVWDDVKSGAAKDVSLWSVETDTVGIDGASNLPIAGDTFRTQGNYSRPDGEAARVLQLPIGKHFKQFDTAIPTLDAKKLPEKGKQYSNQEQCKVTLPFHCYFGPTHQASLDNIRNPFLDISRSIAWYVEGVWANQTPSAFSRAQEITCGVSKEEREEMTHSTGVDVSASYGIGLASGSVSLNYQFTYNTSTSFTEYSEKKVTESFQVDPYYAKVLFSKHVWIKCARYDSSVVLHQMEVISTDDLYFGGCKLPGGT